MKDYLNASEKNQMMVFMSILQLMNGTRNGGINGPKVQDILTEWSKRNNLTKEEHKSLKMAETYLTKFVNSVLERLGKEEKENLEKKLMRYDFRLLDDFTLQKIYRDTKDKMRFATMPREQFFKWCEEIMDVNCRGCNKDWNTCELHKVFDENFIAESSYDMENCRYSYPEDKYAASKKKTEDKKIKEA